MFAAIWSCRLSFRRVLIDGKIEALSIGGKINQYGKVTSKANTNYRGLNQADHNEVCKHVAAVAPTLNIQSQETWGLPGWKGKLLISPANWKSHVQYSRRSVNSFVEKITKKKQKHAIPCNIFFEKAFAINNCLYLNF
jgi:hypothetical protein